MDEIESWQADVRVLLSIPAAFRTEREQIRLWARRVRLLGNGWRVVVSEHGEPVFRYIGNADGWPEYWDEIRKDEFEHVARSTIQSA